MTDQQVSFDTTVPHVARVLDYLQGGTANFEADRQAAEFAFANWPGGDVRVDIRGARAALVRIVRYLTAEAGIRQFLDIGTGLPTAQPVHEVAQRIAPESKVVYVDRDPVVIAHAHQLLAGIPTSSVAFIDGDMHDPEGILRDAAATLDFDRPVALVLFGILHFFTEEEDPARIMKTLLDAVPSGSYVAFSHFARADGDDAMDATFEQLNKQWGESVVRRTRSEAADLFFPGLEPVEPGVVELPDWRPDVAVTGPRPLPMWVGVARKP
ncbi:SAM-dependent methyltransferase [Micromonospora sp. KC207]|uniref:SAM-dependent methyltransferase n=1 Tax=Micromonospora sp. KC207 TaxID=2530377 RepID=UPI001404F6D3|nr:SAM-dependent methyltransferase [Micromonospora sp. KC207]